MTEEQRGRGELRCSRPTADTLRVELSGSWRLQDEVPSLTDITQSLEAAPRVQRLTFETIYGPAVDVKVQRNSA